MVSAPGNRGLTRVEREFMKIDLDLKQVLVEEILALPQSIL